jgi:hypothetical protein
VAGTRTGVYLRVALNETKPTSQAATASAWASYVDTNLSGRQCPDAAEMMFFDPSGETGAGILFPHQPPGWDAILEREPTWRLLDARGQPVTTPVCFFPADESRRPPGW